MYGYIWLSLGIIFLIAEVFTADFLFASMGIASLVASISAFIGLNITLQVVIFSISLVLIFSFIRPFVKKFIQGENNAKKLGLNTLVGKKGIVTINIKKDGIAGKVKIDGDVWTAISDNNEEIEEGTHVEVKRTEGINLYVVKI